MSNSTNVVPFDFEGNDVRIIDQEGGVWFILKDVLSAMGSSTRPAIAKTSIEQGLGDGVYDEYPIKDSLGRSQNITIISESAVTFLVSRSNTETGKRLNRWIHGEVLPSIRKTGSYSLQAQLPNFNDPVEAARAWADAKEQAITAEALALEHQKKIEEDAPKVGFYEDVGDAKNLLTMGNAIKNMNIPSGNGGYLGRNKAFELLRGMKILQSSTAYWNQPYQQYINQGYFVVKGITLPNGIYKTTTYVTGKGFRWIHKKLTE